MKKFFYLMRFNDLSYKTLFLFIVANAFFQIFFQNYSEINFNQIVNFTDFSSQLYLIHIYKFNLVYGKDTIFQLGPLAMVRNFVFDPKIFFDYLFLRSIFFFSHIYLAYAYLKYLNVNKFVLLFLLYIFTVLLFLDQDGIYYIFFVFLNLSIFFNVNKFTKGILIFVIAFHCLIKITFFILALFSLFIFILHKKKLSEFLYISFVFIASLLVLNFFAGFSFESLSNYLFGNLDFFSGYSEGHVWAHKPLETLFLILIIFFNYFLILILLKKNSFYSNFVSSIFYFGLSYVAYKHAITRHDAHIWHSLVFYLFLSLLLFSIFFYTKNFFLKKKFAKSFFLFFIFSIYFNNLIFKNYYDTNYFKVFKDISNDVFIENLFNPIKKITSSTLYNFKNKKKNFYESKNNLEKSNTIEKKFDIFSDNPMLGFVYETNYFPRPGNYSFNTYGFKNIDLNKKHYLKDELKFILLTNDFNSKVDRRFFLNMDNFIWPIIYENFEFEKKLFFNNQAFLKMKKIKKSDFTFKTINTKEANFNEIIKLDYCNKNIQYCSIKLHIQRTLFGRLIDFFYKPVPYVIEFSSNNQIFKYRITFANAKNGFLIKPFFFDIDSVAAKRNCRLNLISCPKIDSFKITPYSQVVFLNYDLTNLYAKKFVIEEAILEFDK